MSCALAAMVKAMAAEAARLAPRTISPAAGFILVEGESAMREIARAGLAAIRTPSGDVLDAGACVQAPRSNGDEDFNAEVGEDEAEQVFQAMIDAILTP